MPKVQKKTTTSRKAPLGKGNGNAGKSPATKPSSTKAAAQPSAIKSKNPNARAQTGAPVSESQSKQRSKVKYGGPNYLLYTRLRGTVDPTITRLLSVSSQLNFAQLHDVMQITFGWASCHMYTFFANEMPPSKDRGDNGPFTFPKSMLFISDQNVLHDDSQWKDARLTTLADYFGNDEYRDRAQLVYEYDMGDSWEHDIVFLGEEGPGMRRQMMIPPEVPAICIGGEGHPCAEDCGSIPGWEHLKALFAKPRSRDPDDRRGWYKTFCANGDPKGMDPYKWNILDVNAQLIELAGIKV